MVNVYAEETNSIIHAEYCLAYDTANCGFFLSDWKLRISNLFENVDFPKLDEEKAQCSWSQTNVYARINNERILLDDNLSMCFDCGIKFSLRHNFSYINPWKCYSISTIINEKYFDLFNSLAGKNIFIEWEKLGTCGKSEDEIFKDTISGKFQIAIKGKCSEEDLLWNSKYDIHAIPSPIDTLYFEEYDDMRYIRFPNVKEKR